MHAYWLANTLPLERCVFGWVGVGEGLIEEVRSDLGLEKRVQLGSSGEEVGRPSQAVEPAHTWH